MHARLDAALTCAHAVQNESRELERRLQQEGLRANVLNMQQVIKDLEEIKAENYALTQRIAELGQ
jgi:hypothetical protein